MRMSGTPSVVSARCAERATRERRDVADDCDRKVFEIALVLANRQRVEQPLGRVRDVRFASRDHGSLAVHGAGHLLLDAGLGVADDEDVHLHREQRVGRVEERLALGAGGERIVEVDDVSALPERGELEGRTRAGRGLTEEVRDREATQRFAPRRLRGKRLCAIEEIYEQRAREAVERDEMPQPAGRVDLGKRGAHVPGCPGWARSHCSSRRRAASRSTSPRRTRFVFAPLRRRSRRSSSASRDVSLSSTR